MKKNFKNEILKRAMIAFDCNYVNDIAALFNTSPQNINGYIDRGTFISLIQDEALKRRISIDWLLTGQGEMMAGINKNAPVAESIPPYGRIPTAPSSYEDALLGKTRKVILSDSVFRRALDSNIEAFHEAVDMKERLTETEAKLARCEDQIDHLMKEIAQLKDNQIKKAV